MADRSAYNRYNASKRAAQEEMQAAGLRLRERQLEQSQAEADERADVSRGRLLLDQQKEAYDQQKDILETTMKMKARQQSIHFMGALSRLDERDPDFEQRVAALSYQFPLGVEDPSSKGILNLKRAAHASVRDRVMELEQANGVSPWNSAFTERDDAGRWRGTRWDKYGDFVAQKKRVDAATDLATVEKLMPGGGKATVKVGGVSAVGELNTPQVTVTKIAEQGLEPEDDIRGKLNKMNLSDDERDYIVGLATKAKQDTKTKLVSTKTRMQQALTSLLAAKSMAAKNAVGGAGTAEFDKSIADMQQQIAAIDAELSAPKSEPAAAPVPEPAAAPVSEPAPKAKTSESKSLSLQDYLDMMNRQ